RRGVVGEQGLRIADHLELHEVIHAELAREMQRANRVVGRVAARGVRQEDVLLAIDRVEDGLLLRQIHTAQRDGHDLGARRSECRARLVVRLVLAGADDDPRRQLSICELPGVDSVHGSASSNKGDDLESIAVREHRRRVLRARNDLAIALDGNWFSVETELRNQCEHGCPGVHDPPLSVDDHVDARRHRGENLPPTPIMRTRCPPPGWPPVPTTVPEAIQGEPTWIGVMTTTSVPWWCSELWSVRHSFPFK